MCASPIQNRAVTAPQTPATTPTKPSSTSPQEALQRTARQSQPRNLNLEARAIHAIMSPVFLIGAALVSPISIGCGLLSCFYKLDSISMMSEGARFEKSIQSMERSAKYWEDLALLPIDLAVGALASAIKGDNSAMPRRLGEFWEL